MKQQKKVRLFILLGCTILLLSAAGFFCFTSISENEQRIQNDKFKEENTHVYNIGERVALDSDEDDRGLDYGFYVASFSWHGTIEYTILDARIYDSLEETGVAAESSFNFKKDNEGDNRYLLLNLRLRNIDAELTNEKSRYLYIATFVNVFGFGEENTYTIGRIVYFSGTAPDADPVKEVLAFTLDKGEEKEFSTVVEIPNDELSGKLYVGSGLAFYQKYAVSIDLQEGASV